MNQRVADSCAASRRGFLKLGAAAVACGVLLPRASWAATMSNVERKLSFVNLHTGERLTAAYWQNGAYQPGALGEIDELLRDWRTGEVKAMDVDLLDLLWDLQRRLESRKPFEVISGYRSPKTNAMLASTSTGVAKKSLHMRGMAIDINLPGTELKTVRDTAIAMRRGGVGYYPKSGFVHVDTGRVRFW